MLQTGLLLPRPEMKFQYTGQAGRTDAASIFLAANTAAGRCRAAWRLETGFCWDDSAIFCKVPTLAVPSFVKPGVGADQVSGTEYIDCRVSWVVWWEEWLDGISFASI